LLPAAAAAAVIVIAMVVVPDDEPTVTSGPVATDPTVAPAPRAVLEFRPVLSVQPCVGAESGTPGDDGLCYELGDPLPGNELLSSVGVFASFSSTGEAIGGDPPSEPTTTTTALQEFGVTLSMTVEGTERFNALATQCIDRTAACPTGQLAVLVDDVIVSAPTIQSLKLDDEPLQLSGDFTQEEAEALARALRPATGPGADDTMPPTDDEVDQPVADDPTVGQPGDSAKDVAERFTREVFGVEYVTVDAQDFEGVTEVTMEGENTVLVADVTFDGSLGVHRLLSLRHPEVTFAPRLSDGFYVVTPTSGQLTVTTYGGRDRFDPSTAEEVLTTRIEDAGPQHGPYELPEHSWLRMDLVADDGRVLRYFGSAGD
jgi:hypothetical protein